jgi:hypothetical protein
MPNNSFTYISILATTTSAQALDGWFSTAGHGIAIVSGLIAIILNLKQFFKTSAQDKLTRQQVCNVCKGKRDSCQGAWAKHCPYKKKPVKIKSGEV